MMTEYSNYFQHLKNRSFKGGLYRYSYLYPRLSSHLSGTVLDIGCGMGSFLKFRPNTIGIDINPLNVEYCRKQSLNAYVIHGERYEFDNEFFDCAIMDNVLEHISDPAPTLREIKRVLKPSGKLLIGVPGQRGCAYDPDHKVFYDKSKLLETVSPLGFEPVLFFNTPFSSRFFDSHLRQYSLYGLFSLS